MDRQSRQKALDEITPEELDRIKAHQAATQGAYPVDQEWLLLAEFAITFGWDAYIAATNDQIETAEMMTLIEASRKLRAGKLYDMATAAFIGAGSAQTKKPSTTFATLTKGIIKNTKADN